MHALTVRDTNRRLSLARISDTQTQALPPGAPALTGTIAITSHSLQLAFRDDLGGSAVRGRVPGEACTSGQRHGRPAPHSPGLVRAGGRRDTEHTGVAQRTMSHGRSAPVSPTGRDRAVKKARALGFLSERTPRRVLAGGGEEGRPCPSPGLLPGEPEVAGGGGWGWGRRCV